MDFALESLPNEILYRILSNLNLRDRMRVGKCSKSMSEAITRSDLQALEMNLWFNRNYSLHVNILGAGGSFLQRADYNNDDSLSELEVFLRQKFRRVRFNVLRILCEKHDVSEATVAQVAAQFDYRVLHLHFDERLQPGVLEFSRRSNKPITLYTSHCDLDARTIIAFPTMTKLFVMQTQSFNDEQVIQIARREHKDISLPANLSETSTLHRLIEIVGSSEAIDRLEVRVASSYFHRFLTSVNLREDGSQLLNVSDPNSPVTWGEMTDLILMYYLDFGAAYLMITPRTFFSEHRVEIMRGRMPQNLLPAQAISLHQEKDAM